MSVLDQAFIKAFSRQSTALPLQPKTARPELRPNTAAVSPDASSTDVAPNRPARECVAVKPQDESFGAVLAALERPPVRPAPAIKAAVGPSSSEAVGAGGLCAMANVVWPAESQLWTIETQPWMPESPPSPPCRETPCEAIVAEVPQVPAAKTLEMNTETVEPVAEQPPRPLPAEETTDQPPANIKMFRPAWQVERFSWPRVCRRLMSRASGEWDRLVDAVQTAGDEGRKVLAIAGHRRGEGATTVLLCVARRLAERGMRTALADADLARPRLAKRLGVQAQCGWDETTDGGAEQAVVEAERGALALLTLREPTANLPGNWRRWLECIDALRNRYRTVLVDPGPLERVGDDVPPWAADGAVDAVLLVHNHRVTSEGELQHLRRQLTSAGVPVVGVIENFVAE